MAIPESQHGSVTPPLRPGRGGMLLSVRVTPKSSRDGVTGLHAAGDGSLALSVRVTAPPDKGKANEAVIEVLAKASHLPKSAFCLAAGGSGRHKSLLVTGNTAALEALIASFTDTGKNGPQDGEDH